MASEAVDPIVSPTRYRAVPLCATCIVQIGAATDGNRTRNLPHSKQQPMRQELYPIPWSPSLYSGYRIEWTITLLGFIEYIPTLFFSKMLSKLNSAVPFSNFIIVVVRKANAGENHSWMSSCFGGVLRGPCILSQDDIVLCWEIHLSKNNSYDFARMWPEQSQLLMCCCSACIPVYFSQFRCVWPNTLHHWWCSLQRHLKFQGTAQQDTVCNYVRTSWPKLSHCCTAILLSAHMAKWMCMVREGEGVWWGRRWRNDPHLQTLE